MVVKRRYQRILLQRRLEHRDYDEFKAEVRQAIAEAVPLNHDRILQVHYKDVRRYLKLAWELMAKLEVEQAE